MNDPWWQKNCNSCKNTNIWTDRQTGGQTDATEKKLLNRRLSMTLFFDWNYFYWQWRSNGSAVRTQTYGQTDRRMDRLSMTLFFDRNYFYCISTNFACFFFQKNGHTVAMILAACVVQLWEHKHRQTDATKYITIISLLSRWYLNEHRPWRINFVKPEILKEILNNSPDEVY